jgi:hypothetical protein
MVEARRFPPPRTVEETDACFIVRDHAGMSLAYVYFEEEPGRRSAAHLLTRDEARRDNSQYQPAPITAASKFSIGPATYSSERPPGSKRTRYPHAADNFAGCARAALIAVPADFNSPY